MSERRSWRRLTMASLAYTALAAALIVAWAGYGQSGLGVAMGSLWALCVR